MRSYEVKHACYGGTLALRQALEWRLSLTDVQPKRFALVIAADVCRYAPGHPAEVTQGAGAVAMIVGEEKVAAIQRQTYPYSDPCFDFWRPSGEAFPRVHGSLGVKTYRAAAEHCFHTLFQDQPDLNWGRLSALCFHVPFPQMVIKAFKHLGTTFHLSEAQSQAILNEKILPNMEWNRDVGNAYCASLWLSVAQALGRAQPRDQIACFSYGSGCGAELFIIERTGKDAPWAQDVHQDLANRTIISPEAYQAWRS